MITAGMGPRGLEGAGDISIGKLIPVRSVDVFRGLPEATYRNATRRALQPSIALQPSRASQPNLRRDGAPPRRHIHQASVLIPARSSIRRFGATHPLDRLAGLLPGRLRGSVPVNPIGVSPHVPTHPCDDEKNDQSHHDPHGANFGLVGFLLCHRRPPSVRLDCVGEAGWVARLIPYTSMLDSHAWV